MTNEERVEAFRMVKILVRRDFGPQCLLDVTNMIEFLYHTKHVLSFRIDFERLIEPTSVQKDLLNLAFAKYQGDGRHIMITIHDARNSFSPEHKSASGLHYYDYQL